jgi:hypothetical protein
MSLLLDLFARKHWMSTSLTPTPDRRSRKRLQKPPRGGNSEKGLYLCKDVFGIVLAQSCLTLFWDDTDLEPIDETSVDETSVDETSVNETPAGGGEVFQGHVGFLESELSTCSVALNQPYTSDEIEERVFPKRRAKTPVLFVGQLESDLHNSDEPDLASILAEQYCTLLPERTWTPFTTDVAVGSIQKKTLRKIETRQNLRSFVSDCPELSFSPDSGTLVGSDITPPDSPTPTGDHYKILPAFENYEKGARSNEKNDFLSHEDDGQKSQPKILENKGFLDNNEDSLDTNSCADANIGLQICLDLLTNELASATFRHHPAECEFRASGLQIWLMIEAYESVRHRLRQEYRADYFGPIEEVLSHWLQALYSVYQLSQAKELDISAPATVTCKPRYVGEDRVTVENAKTQGHGQTLT